MRKVRTITAAIAGCIVLAGGAASAQVLSPKSDKERDALVAIQNAPDADTRLKRIDDMLAAFADTAYKPVLLDMAVEVAQEKNDYPLTVAWAERDLEAYPNSYVAMLALATSTAANTKEFDLDKNEKLAKAEKYANQALATIKTAPRPAQLAEDKWPQAQKYFESTAHQALGMIATARKKYDDAIAEYKTAFDIFPDAGAEVRLGDACVKAGKYDDAIAAFDKVMAMPDVAPQVKQFAQNAKNNALKKKGGASGTPAAAAPAAPAAPPAAAPATPSPQSGADTKK